MTDMSPDGTARMAARIFLYRIHIKNSGMPGKYGVWAAAGKISTMNQKQKASEAYCTKTGRRVIVVGSLYTKEFIKLLRKYIPAVVALGCQANFQIMCAMIIRSP